MTDDTPAEKAETFQRTMDRTFAQNYRAMDPDDSREWYVAEQARADLRHKTTKPDRPP